MSTTKTSRNKNRLLFSRMPRVKKVTFPNGKASFHLSDGRIIGIPINKIRRLKNATTSQRRDYKVQGHFVFWDNVNEIVGVKNLLDGSIMR